MNFESELKLQAYLDGELSGRESREVAALLESDPEARKLSAELKMTKQALAGNEAEVKLSESREFYWSKIQREIERAEAQPARPHSVLDWIAAWRRVLAPVAGVTLIAFLTVYSFRLYDGGDDSRHLAVVENLSEHTGAYSFRSQSDKMFVVWVYDRSTEADSETDEEMTEQ